jgi:TonB family protein
LSLLNKLIQTPRSAFKAAIVISLGLHIVLLAVYIPTNTKVLKKIEESVVTIKLDEPKPKQEEVTPLPAKQTLITKVPATQAAPSAPTAEEWAFASKYTLKNSKGYRHSWGKQVRSMMGTAVEGVDQGEVRFRIEIAPNGSIIKVETLWKTSDKAEQLARKAIKSMPPLPPTPTGNPLIFEKTILFSPFANDDSPIYRDDCLPDPPEFNNPFSWDGKSPQEIKKNKPAEQLSPEALAECLKQLPQDSIESITAEDQRHLDLWSSGKLKQGK